MLINGFNDTGEKREKFCEFSKKFKMAPMEYLGAWGTLIHEKNLKSKISCQTPCKSHEGAWDDGTRLCEYNLFISKSIFFFSKY